MLHEGYQILIAPIAREGNENLCLHHLKESYFISLKHLRLVSTILYEKYYLCFQKK